MRGEADKAARAAADELIQVRPGLAYMRSGMVDTFKRHMHPVIDAARAEGRRERDGEVAALQQAIKLNAVRYAEARIANLEQQFTEQNLKLGAAEAALEQMKKVRDGLIVECDEHMAALERVRTLCRMTQESTGAKDPLLAVSGVEEAIRGAR